MTRDQHADNQGCRPGKGQAGPQCELQAALFRVLKSLVFRSAAHSPLDELPISQLRCLHVVHHEEGLRMADLAERLELKLPAVSQSVDRLVKRGLVERCRDPQDRRVVRLSLTSPARCTLEAVERERHARMDATTAHLPDPALQMVIEGLQLLAGAAEKVEAAEKESGTTLQEDTDALVAIAMRRRARRAAAAPDPLSPEQSPPVHT